MRSVILALGLLLWPLTALADTTSCAGGRTLLPGAWCSPGDPLAVVVSRDYCGGVWASGSYPYTRLGPAHSAAGTWEPAGPVLGDCGCQSNIEWCPCDTALGCDIATHWFSSYLHWSMTATPLTLDQAARATAPSACPASFDVAAAPYGLCQYCGCPVSPIANGKFGCACQPDAAPCGDPNANICGPVTTCPASDLCTPYAWMTCTSSLTGSPSDVSLCLIPGTRLVNPWSCTCTTATIKVPLTPEQKAAARSLSGVLYSISSVTAAFSGTLPSSFNAIKLAITGTAYTVGGALARIADDPPDLTTFTVLDVPVFPAPVKVGTDVTPAQAALLRQWQDAASRAQGYCGTSANSLDRAAGAFLSSSPDWQAWQIANYNQYVPACQQAMADLRSVQATFTSTTWAAQKKPREPDLRPVLAPLADPSLLQSLLDGSQADLVSR